MNWGVFGRPGLSFRSDSRTAKNESIYVHIPYQRGFNATFYENILSTFSDCFTRKLEVTVSGGSTFARVKLKEIDGMAPQDVERAV
jgi:hypothetical protein